MSSSAAAQLSLFFGEHFWFVCCHVSRKSVDLPLLSSILCFELLCQGVCRSQSEAQATGNQPAMILLLCGLFT